VEEIVSLETTTTIADAVEDATAKKYQKAKREYSCKCSRILSLLYNYLLTIIFSSFNLGIRRT
jgi:hypothetical protein